MSLYLYYTNDQSENVAAYEWLLPLIKNTEPGMKNTNHAIRLEIYVEDTDAGLMANFHTYRKSVDVKESDYSKEEPSKYYHHHGTIRLHPSFYHKLNEIPGVIIDTTTRTRQGYKIYDTVAVPMEDLDAVKKVANILRENINYTIERSKEKGELTDKFKTDMGSLFE